MTNQRPSIRSEIFSKENLERAMILTAFQQVAGTVLLGLALLTQYLSKNPQVMIDAAKATGKAAVSAGAIRVQPHNPPGPSMGQN